MKKINALLVSMPWADFQFPSLQIGCLAAYAGQKGFDVECRHLHLEMAAYFGLKEYDRIAFYPSYCIGELFFAIHLFPKKKRHIFNYLRKHIANPENYSVKILNAVRKIYHNINWSEYDLVGFTISYEQLFASLLFAKWLKRDFPHLKVVFGGPHVAGQLGTSLLECFPQVDWCVDGEGEIAFTELLSCFSRGITNLGDCVPGLIYRYNGCVRINPRRQLSKFSGLPDPDFEHYFQLLGHHPLLSHSGIVPFLPIESSRGCPHCCAFCSVHLFWSGYRMRPPQEVATQLERLSDRYLINRFMFVDSNVPIRHVRKLFPLIERQNRDYYIFYNIRANTDKAQLEAMRRAGVREVQIGVEALSTSLLRKMNKGTRVIDNLKIMKFCEEFEIKQFTAMMIGFPTESQLDVDETVRNIEYASAYRPPSQLLTFGLYQGSPVYNQPDKYEIFQIRNASFFETLFPPPIAENLAHMVKEYSSHQRNSDYRALKRRVDLWQKEYTLASRNNKKLLSYYDLGTFLCIEDFRSRMEEFTPEREAVTTITLEEKARDLYLFCDLIRCFDEIKNEFPNWSEREVRKLLDRLVKMRVMFREGDDYLSLAIRANDAML